MEIDPMDERELYNKYNRNNSNNMVSTTVSSIVVQGGPLQLVIALLRVSFSASTTCCINSHKSKMSSTENYRYIYTLLSRLRHSFNSFLNTMKMDLVNEMKYDDYTFMLRNVDL